MMMVADGNARQLCVLRLQGGQVVVYGCLSGKTPALDWQTWVFRGIKARAISSSTSTIDQS